MTRAVTFALLLLCAVALSIFGAPACPIWLLGLPCPTCGLTRAVAAMMDGGFLIAFKFNPFFLYYAVLSGSVLLGFFLFIAGAERTPESFAQRTAFSVPHAVHVSIILLSAVANLYHYGINPDGLVVTWLKTGLLALP